MHCYISCGYTQLLPKGIWLRLGSAWVSDVVKFSCYTENNYPRSTFDLALFGGKIKIMEIPYHETYGLLVIILVLPLQRWPIDLAMQQFVLRRTRRRQILRNAK